MWTAVKLPPTVATAPPPACSPVAWFSDRMTFERRTLAPSFRRPPPSAIPPGADTEPCVIVRSLISTLMPAPEMEKTRVTSLPLTVTFFAPGPPIVTSSVMLSTLPSRIVPFNPGANLIVAAPGLALAASIAARNEPGPPSERFVTVNVCPAGFGPAVAVPRPIRCATRPRTTAWIATAPTCPLDVRIVASLCNEERSPHKRGGARPSLGRRHRGGP